MDGCGGNCMFQSVFFLNKGLGNFRLWQHVYKIAGSCRAMRSCSLDLWYFMNRPSFKFPTRKLHCNDLEYLPYI